MQFGLFFVLQHHEAKSEAQVVAETLEQIAYADQLGFDGVWVAEHHFSRHGIAGSPLQVLTYAAATTRRVRLGLAVSILPFSHPIHIAEQAAMLDIMSGGRLNFGVGRGYLEPEFRGFGLELADSTALFRESLDVIQGAWAHEIFSYHGKHYCFDDLRIAPHPIQRPHPPMYVASISPASLAWAAERGLAVMSGGTTPYPELKQARLLYRDELARRGSGPSLYASCPLQRNLFVADSTEEARAVITPELMWAANTALHAGSSARQGQYAADYQYYERVDRLRRERATAAWDDSVWADEEAAPLVGDPAEVTRRLKVVESALDLGYLMGWMNVGAVDHRAVLRSMELFAREVIPHFREPAVPEDGVLVAAAAERR